MVSPVGCRRLHTLAAVRRIVCLLGASAGFAAGLAGHTCEMLTGYSEEPKPLKAYLGLMGVFGALSVGGGGGGDAYSQVSRAVFACRRGVARGGDS